MVDVRVGLVLVALSILAARPSLAGGVLEGRVVRVDDGDTIDVRVGDRLERVRYIGLDAPEVGHHGVGGAPGGLAAARMNAALLGDGRVRLELDAEERDSYGRLLAYVWVGDRMINAELLGRGYARALRIPPNLRYAALFAALEREARRARRGLWAGSAYRSPGITSRAISSMAPRSSWSSIWSMTRRTPSSDHRVRSRRTCSGEPCRKPALRQPASSSGTRGKIAWARCRRASTSAGDRPTMIGTISERLIVA